MPRFVELEVAEVRPETADSVQVAFKVPEALKEEFAFKAGQYLTLRKEIQGEDLRRTYSLCSAPQDPLLRVGIKKVPGGRFSTWANESLKTGDKIQVMKPMGRFTLPEPPPEGRHVVAFAAGSGITPVLSMLQEVLAGEENSTFTLFFGNKNTGSIMFKETLEGLKNRYPHRFALHHILSRESMDIPLFSGRIDGERCDELCQKLLRPAGGDTYLVCGPGDMIEQVKQRLVERGVAAEQIKFEMFSAPGQKVTDRALEENQAPTLSGETSRVTVILDGLHTSFDLDKEGAAVLDAALEAGADAPYACKGAVCATCKAKVLKGKSRMALNYALSPEEVEAGFTLACQTHPVDEALILSFDH